MTTETLDKMLSRAKIGIMQKPDTAFFSALCSGLNTHFSQELPTAGTNGLELIINPEFFKSLTVNERIFLLAHETLHVAYLHVLRKEARNPEIWNMAADYVINLELVDRGFTFIKGGLLDEKYRGMGTEEVYSLLMQEVENLPKLPMSDLMPLPSGTVEGEDGKPSLLSTPEAVQAEIQSKISRAIMVAEMQNQSGSVPDSIKRHFKDLTKPQVNWRVVLQRFISQLTQDDYSWRRPNKKYLPHYLPKLNSKTLSRLDFAIDTSGSITEAQFVQFVSEVHSILRMLNPKQIGVYQFDHKLQGSHVVKNVMDLLTLPFSGGGGTRPQSALDEFEKNKALGLIVLTDGHFYQSMLKDPKRPVIWVVYNNPNFTPPFGTAVHFELKAA